MMRNALLSLLALTVLLGAAGCSRVSQLYYLRGSFDPAGGRGLPLDQVYAGSQMASLRGKTIEVRMADPLRSIDKDTSKITPLMTNDLWHRFEKDYESDLANELWYSAVFSDVCTAQDSTPIAKPDYLLKYALTQWHEGNGWLRAFLGFGLGATREQLEGAIVDTRTGTVVFAFADARCHPGGPSVMGFPSRVFRGPALLREDLDFTATDLADTLRTLTGTDTPKRPDTGWRPLFRAETVGNLAVPDAPAKPDPTSAPTVPEVDVQ